MDVEVEVEVVCVIVVDADADVDVDKVAVYTFVVVVVFDSNCGWLVFLDALNMRAVSKRHTINRALVMHMSMIFPTCEKFISLSR